MKPKPPTCDGCPAQRVGKGYVPGEGPSTASIALLGQGPGEEEAWTSRPFVGPSGRTLDWWLVRAGVERHKVWVDNVVRCWLPGNRAPTSAEIAHCRKAHWEPALRAHTQLNTLVPIGVPSGKAILGPKYSMSQAGIVREVDLG